MTISDAAKKVLQDTGRTMKAKELVSEIESRGLFKFGAKQPESVLTNTLRKKSDIFVKTDDGFKLVS
jgi:restriction system protein